MTTESTDEEPNGKLLECSHCPKTFRYSSERLRHEMSHSPGFECETCCKKFSFISALRRHQKQHKREGSVKCEECNRKFRDEELLRRHVNYAHKGTFRCSECDSTFSSDQALRTHMKIHKPVSERRYKCNFLGCGKSFNFSHHLKHHEYTHTDVKQHYCNVCGKGFIQSHHLKAHLKSHDPSECVYCDFSGCKKTFSTQYAKKRHMARCSYKKKTDSGISSDSNSCDAFTSKEYPEDIILCAACGDNVPRNNFSMHSLKCGDMLDISSDIESCKIDSIKEENVIDEPTIKDKIVSEKVVDDCKSALGACIMSANNCVCAQMTRPNDENYDFTPIGNTDYSTIEKNNNIVTVENITDFYDKESVVVFNMNCNNELKGVLKRADIANEKIIPNKKVNLKPYSQDSVRSNMCEGCECASTCDIKESANFNGNKIEDVSNVEYTIEGVVKIKDTFDIDMPVKVDYKVQAETNVLKESDEFVSFGTCKDVIGNCIAGGKEGCLCARMMMDNQQAMAQEIDDITPVPKTESYT